VDPGAAEAEGSAVTDVEVGQWAAAGDQGEQGGWYRELLAQAEDVAAGRLSFFGLEAQELGDPIDWNRDHKRQQATPMTFCGRLDYRDVNVAGDCKFVWEPNRHHQFVVLGRAYRASGDVRYAEALIRQWDGWLRQNPYGVGMNWRSPLELGIRLINWVWAADLIRPSGLVAGEFRRRLLGSVDRHIWEIDRKYSKGSSANNHVVGEAAGAFVAASYFPYLKRATRWRRRAERVLLERLLDLTCGDGGLREQAVGYHLFVLQFAVVASLVARWTGREFPAEFTSRVEKMFEFLGALSEGGDALPMFGDADDGYVLDLGGPPRDARGWLSVGALLFGRGDFKAQASGYRQPARWLCGRGGAQRFEEIDTQPAGAAIGSRAFPETGLYLLQCGRCGRDDRISVAFDCGAHGFGSIAAHAHADALSFTLRAFGTDVLVDPGTYDYFSHRRWRDYFRSTRAHNTVVVDGRDQSEMQGLFLWGERARARCLAWSPNQAGGKVIGEHDGYRYLEDPVNHRRTLELDGAARRLTVWDELVGSGRHDVVVYFHLAEQCRIRSQEGNAFTIDVGRGTMRIELDARLSAESWTGSEDPIAGWVSRGYHRKTPATTLAGRGVADNTAPVVCRIDLGDPAGG